MDNNQQITITRPRGIVSNHLSQGDLIEDAVIIEEAPTKRSPFITANSEELSKEILKRDIVPVFSRSDDAAISSIQFIEACEAAMRDFYI